MYVLLKKHENRIHKVECIKLYTSFSFYYGHVTIVESNNIFVDYSFLPNKKKSKLFDISI